MSEPAIITFLRATYRRFAGPRAVLSEVPLAVMRRLVGNHFKVRLDGYDFLVDLRDTVVSFQILTKRSYEPLETALLMNLVRSGDRVVDCGAHIGYYTVSFAHKVGNDGRVLAIEPQPLNVGLLRKNIALSALESIVTVAPYGAGSERTTSFLYEMTPGNRGDNRVYDRKESSHGAGASFEISIVPIDEMTAAWDRVDLVKMDIQGYEPRALEGMKATIALNYGLIIVMEFSPHLLRIAGNDPHDLLTLLCTAGFEIWEIGRTGITKADLRTITEKFGDTEAYTDIVCARPGVVRADGKLLRRT